MLRKPTARHRQTVFILAVAASCALMRQAAANELQDLQDPDLQRIYDHPSWLVGSTGADGAVSVNADYEGGASSVWYIEQQRYGGELVRAGVSRLFNHGPGDSLGLSTIRQGIWILQWGMNTLVTDPAANPNDLGSFCFGTYAGAGRSQRTSDPFHSAALYTLAAADAMTTLRQYCESATMPGGAPAARRPR